MQASGANRTRSLANIREKLSASRSWAIPDISERSRLRSSRSKNYLRELFSRQASKQTNSLIGLFDGAATGGMYRDDAP